MFNVFIVEDEQTIVDVLHAYFEKEDGQSTMQQMVPTDYI